MKYHAIPRHTSIDLPTAGVVLLLAYLVASFAHDVVGHGGACLLVGGRPLRLTSASFDCDTHALIRSARIVAAAGTVANLLLAWTLHMVCSRARPSAGVRCTLSLLVVANVFQGLGCVVYAGFVGNGDWADIAATLRPAMAWRIGMGVVGLALFLRVVGRSIGRFLDAAAGSADTRRGQAATPRLRTRPTPSNSAAAPGAPLAIRRNYGIIVVGLLLATAFTAALGHGVTFAMR